MSIIRSLAPFIVYAVLSAVASELVAAGAALVLTAALLAQALLTGSKPAELVVNWACLVFFVGYVTICLALPHGPQGQWIGAAIQLWLAATTTFTLAIRRPFTLAIAKTQAPEQVWNTPEFLRFNLKITRVWAICFLISGLVVATLVALGHSSIAATVVIMVVAILVPVRYTDHLVKGMRP